MKGIFGIAIGFIRWSVVKCEMSGVDRLIGAESFGRQRYFGTKCYVLLLFLAEHMIKSQRQCALPLKEVAERDDEMQNFLVQSVPHINHAAELVIRQNDGDCMAILICLLSILGNQFSRHNSYRRDSHPSKTTSRFAVAIFLPDSPPWIFEMTRVALSRLIESLAMA